ncbi:hypothetical protein E3O55_07430 [Cryobacterium sp. MDB1-18-2]|uniref:hypothetical protein n=1 Tax=unclassified Cryobacterium TaxID=2649013 RepID=UPI001069AD75|nr:MULTISPECIES: hypothetical protein [unclassified Cryobacterium]TFC30804.1 hypothetical protein E3O55_07430 [Cryobacterium sp. MDB1-18-2]TFC38147.1 hypothetical protein E3O50_17150 [Cryobacterium sp. MDB1-18-1]
MTPDSTAQDRSDSLKRRRRLFLRSGQLVMVAGVLIAVTHWLGHLDPATVTHPPVWIELLVNYPVAAVVVIIGANLSSHKPK